MGSAPLPIRSSSLTRDRVSNRAREPRLTHCLPEDGQKRGCPHRAGGRAGVGTGQPGAPAGQPHADSAALLRGGFLASLSPLLVLFLLGKIMFALP